MVSYEAVQSSSRITGGFGAAKKTTKSTYKVREAQYNKTHVATSGGEISQWFLFCFLLLVWQVELIYTGVPPAIATTAATQR